jgi:hypothetical protein
LVPLLRLRHEAATLELFEYASCLARRTLERFAYALQIVPILHDPDPAKGFLDLDEGEAGDAVARVKLFGHAVRESSREPWLGARRPSL